MSKMNLQNGYDYDLPDEKNLLLFGANRIGKTLISIEIKKRYDNMVGFKALLFNDEILQSSFISSNENKDSYSITPFAREKMDIKNDLSELRKKLEIIPILTKYFGEKTSKAYDKFPLITEMLNNTIAIKKELIEVFPGNNKEAEFVEPIFDFGGEIIEGKYDSEFINKCISKKTGIYRFVELIDVLKKEDVFNKVKNTNELFNDINQDEYFMKRRIIYDNLIECPICYSTINDENRQKILEDLNRVILKEDLKKSLQYYLDGNDKRFEEIIINLIASFDETYTTLTKDLEQSIIFVISSEFDKSTILKYKNQILELDKINEKAKDFVIQQEDKNSEIYKEIEKEFAKFKSFSETKINYEIKSGQVLISLDNARIEELSMSEMKFLKFIYFRILFLQNIRVNPSLKIIVIIDDPFDSYDDIYVSDMIEIVFDLLKLNESSVEKFVVLSHSFHSLRLLNERYDYVGLKFKFYWLDIFKDNKEIINIKDEFKVMTKIDKNVSDYGLAMKIIQKMRDSYSLVVFSSLLRENSKFNFYITKKACRTVKKSVNTHKKYYSIISDNINHNKSNMSIERLFKVNNKLYGFPGIVDNKRIKDICDVFSTIPYMYTDLELMREYKNHKIALWQGNDLMHLLIWKFLMVLRIRRILEKKMWNDLSKPKYKTLSDLINLYTVKSGKLYKFYDSYKILFNSFNHSTTENIPPFLIFHASYIQAVLKEAESL